MLSWYPRTICANMSLSSRLGGLCHEAIAWKSQKKYVKFWTYGKSGGATLGKRQNKIFFLCLFV